MNIRLCLVLRLKKFLVVPLDDMSVFELLHFTLIFFVTFHEELALPLSCFE